MSPWWSVYKLAGKVWIQEVSNYTIPRTEYNKCFQDQEEQQSTFPTNNGTNLHFFHISNHTTIHENGHT